MTALSLMPGNAAWRSRHVQYYAGDWDSIQTVLPEFDLKPFAAGPDEPPNPFLKTVMRKPLSAAERPVSPRCCALRTKSRMPAMSGPTQTRSAARAGITSFGRPWPKRSRL